ncbi:MAG: hypothetical protein N3G21_03885, partial [Candidatus Hydrogenedentes bacterium]|nr:hypothetical protein [Candidatus Hydrogenedentota bacterium]
TLKSLWRQNLAFHSIHAIYNYNNPEIFVASKLWNNFVNLFNYYNNPEIFVASKLKMFSLLTPHK